VLTKWFHLLFPVTLWEKKEVILLNWIKLSLGAKNVLHVLPLFLNSFTPQRNFREGSIAKFIHVNVDGLREKLAKWASLWQYLLHSSLLRDRLKLKTLWPHLRSDQLHHYCHFRFIRSKWVTPASAQGQGMTQECECQEAGITGYSRDCNKVTLRTRNRLTHLWILSS
jgi:hypothetical protein